MTVNEKCYENNLEDTSVSMTTDEIVNHKINCTYDTITI